MSEYRLQLPSTWMQWPSCGLRPAEVRQCHVILRRVFPGVRTHPKVASILAPYHSRHQSCAQATKAIYLFKLATLHILLVYHT